MSIEAASTSSFKFLLQKPKEDFPNSFRRAGQGRNAEDLYGDSILRSPPFDCGTETSRLQSKPQTVRRLQKCLNLRRGCPRPRFNTSEPHPEREQFPYLLRKCKIGRPNQVWSTDITYTAVAGHRAFVTRIVDWFTRKVNTMDAFHCVETLKMAVDSYGKPEIFNSDQGSQFTSSEFVAELRNHGIQISMDRRGRCLDNAKMERF